MFFPGIDVPIHDGSRWVLIDMQTLSSQTLNVDEYVFPGDKVDARSHWSRDGKRLTFVRDGHVA